MRLLPTTLLVGILFLILSGVSAQDKLTELYYSGAYQEVIENSSDLIEAGDTVFTTFYLKALAEIQMGQSALAIQTLNRASQYHPDDPRFERMLARQYYEVGDYTRAWNAYLILIRRDSSDVSSWLKLADIASFKQQYNQAIEALNQVLLIDSLNLSSMMMMGEILDRHNNSGAGIYYQRAYHLYPENQKAAFALGNWYLQSHDSWKTVPICKQMLSLDTTNIKFAKLLGYAYYKIANPDQAVKYFQYANNLGDSTAFTFKFKGISHYLRTDFSRSVESLEEAVAKDSMDAEVHFFLGASLAATTEKDDAMFHLNTSLRLMQPDPSVVSRIYSEQGNIKRLQMEYKEAYSFYEKAWDTDSTNAMSLYFMASILDNSMHKSKEALVDYERFIEALDLLPKEEETQQGLSVRAIVEDRILTLKEEIFMLDDH